MAAHMHLEGAKHANQLKESSVFHPFSNPIASRRTARRGCLAAAIAALALSATAQTAAPAPPPPPPARGPAPGPPPPPADPLANTQQDAADAVQRAYDAIDRTAAIAESSQAEGAADLLTQSRNAYQQALSFYQSSKFAGAQETAMMAADLARAADELTSAHLIASARANVPPPPSTGGGIDPGARAYGNLGRLAQHRADVAGRIAASPDAADRAVHRLVEQAGQMERNAQNLLNSGKPQQAEAVARAADALLAACDHSIQRVLIASGRATMAPPPPPPAGPEAPPPPQP